ncbi:hypothetical protein BLNAU_7186 [Blattamonas nauphoetae]|uniref:Uncharacterized protein n=1 Tax=Blattamonas nauphoetae TaxID=2049346 RepID=A0ABQ9Y1Z2_9EUKA|nr:hypothetical protein BLNAU_7186 [Blattamonas nauphoetae]
MPFEDQSTIYNSLVALVKAEHPFDTALQDKAVHFLKSLEPKWDAQLAARLVTDLVPSSAGSYSGFAMSILTLLSSQHSTVVAAALSFLYKATNESSPAIRCCLVESDLISKVLATFQPHTLSIAGNEAIINELNVLIRDCLFLANPSSLNELGVKTAVDAFNHREMIFQKAVIPSSQFVTFLISNRHILNGDLFNNFMDLLAVFIQICPFHRPTLEFVLASPIPMALSSRFSFVEGAMYLWGILMVINYSLKEWKKHRHEVAQSAKRMIQALISEDFEDTLEQMLMNDKDGNFGRNLVDESTSPEQFQNHFCGHSSDVGNARIASADEQILGWPSIVQKWFALLGSSFSTRLSFTVTSSTVLSPNNSLRH